jgi:hypothetical protein
MKIFCNCNLYQRKIYLDAKVKTRRQLANTWGHVFTINCPHCRVQHQVDVNTVRAESSHNTTPIPTTLGGGLIGVLAGPLGIIIGLAVGGYTGGRIRSNDIQDVNNFNTYYL